jgi:hypothetical protein
MVQPNYTSRFKGRVSSKVEMWRAGFNCMFKNMLTAIVFEYITAILHDPFHLHFPTEALHFVER